MQSKKKSGLGRWGLTACVAGLFGVVSISPAFADQPADAAAVAAAAQASPEALKVWHEHIKKVATPAAGCFRAVYPNLTWEKETCLASPKYRSSPKVGPRRDAYSAPQTVGNGYDYSAQTAQLTRSAVGSFPVVSGVTSTNNPNGYGGTNGYTLQLNTNFASGSPACASYGYTSCSVWQQFIYSTYNGADSPAPAGPQAFIQDWMFLSSSDYLHKGCPSGWYSYRQQYACYRNSNAVAVSFVPASQLASASLSGSAVANGVDTVTFTYGGVAHSVTQSDSTLGIAYVWNTSEFNVVGNGGGSEVNFNSGSSLTVKLAVNDGTTSSPSCIGPTNGGTTGETNNLNLGTCSASGGTTPYIQFVESN
ncbi:hypothetical protein WS67_09610 [Burkholderia singularis]|uniref:Secreted protein n=1 Tax=Burkholderia singularis TaxID=1503053 RepID=A0A103E4K7_9BURK|nr:hypothetical protein [Burkholderia singularis]KVE28245.1 hypothetical protein WS67_09610 [Burkholderia singularis]